MDPKARPGRLKVESAASAIPPSATAAVPECPFPEVKRWRSLRWFGEALRVLLMASAFFLGALSESASSLAAPSPSSSAANSSGGRTSMAPVQPTSVALVGADLYITDPGRQEILKRSSTGAFSVVAGTGVAGLSGDGGSATRAKVDDPSNLIALRDGSLLFEQARPGHGSVIREITTAGVIRTVAGARPSCAGVAQSATSIAAQSAKLNGSPLSVDANGSAVLVAQPCPNAHRLGPFLELTRTGELSNMPLDTSPLIHSLLVGCGRSGSGNNFTVFLCESGAGHPKQLLVLRKDGTTKGYPTFGGGAVASAAGRVVAVRDDTVVRVMSEKLPTLASTTTLRQLVPTSVNPSVVALALTSGDIFAITDAYRGHKGCTATISELRLNGARPHVLWSRTSQLCY